jgi:glyoxylase-like metal-dependent hydrolase (beta-lactamase superfamily II)
MAKQRIMRTEHMGKDGWSPMTADGMTVYPVVCPTSLPAGDVNMYVLDHGDGDLTLIDAGVDTEECLAVLQDTMRSHGFGLQQIRRIWLTHSHPDHTGLVNRIAAAVPDVRVYAHRDAWLRMKRDPAFLEMRVRFYERLYREMGCGEAGERQVRYLRRALETNASQRLIPDIVPLSEGDELEGLTVLEVPGHSPDHIAFWDSRRKWLFGGDVLLRHISSNAFVEPDAQGNRRRTLLEQTESLNRLLDVGPGVIFAGHGGVIDAPEPLIRLRLSRIGAKAERILGLIADRRLTAWELARMVYPQQVDKQFGPVMSEIIGLLDYLETMGKIGKTAAGEVWQYHVSNQ